MGSLPLLSSRDGVQVVAALLGHARPSPTSCFNARALDSIFDEIVDSLRLSFPLRRELEVGAAAVSSVLNALHDISVPTPNPISPSTRSSHHHLPSLRSHPHAPPPTPLPSSDLPVVHAPAITSNPPPAAHASSLPPLPTPQHGAGGGRVALQNTVPATQQSRQEPQSHPLSVQRRPRRPPRKKRYHDAVPSTHCHVCCRPSTAVPMAVCSNIKEGTCRKVVCNRCIVENGWDWNQAVAENSSWICPHCTDSCMKVPRAQCWVYMRTNSRRRENRNKRLRTSASEGAAGGGVSGAVGVSCGGRQPPSVQAVRHQQQEAQGQAFRHEQEQLLEPERKVPRKKLQLEQSLQQAPQHHQQQHPRQQQQQHQHQRTLLERRNLDSRITIGERVSHAAGGVPQYSAAVAPVYGGVAAAGIVHTQALALANNHGNVNGTGKFVRDRDY